MKTKQFIILLVTIPVLLLFLGAGYYFYTQYQKTVKAPPAKQPPAAGGPQQLVRGPVISPVLSFDGQKIWYLTAEGQMFRQAIEPGSQPQEYQFPIPLPSATTIIWPEAGNDFIAVQGSGSQSGYEFFNSRKNIFVPYPLALSKPQFLSTSDKIVYQWAASATAAQLVVSDSDGTNYHKVADLLSPNFQFVASPRKPEVALFSADPSNPLKLFLVDLLTSQFQALTDKGAFSGVKFSPDGTKLLIAPVVGQNNSGVSGGSLLTYDLATGTLQDLGLVSDIAHVAWSKDSSFLVFGSATGFVKYTLSTATTQDLYKFKNTDNFDPVQILLHPDKSILFFTDKNTGNLYTLNLP